MAEMKTPNGLVVGLIPHAFEDKAPVQDEKPVQVAVPEAPKRGRKPKEHV